MHACYNCRFYSASAYNECKESQAERVLDKDRNNYCDYFKFAEGQEHIKGSADKDKARRELDDLFK